MTLLRPSSTRWFEILAPKMGCEKLLRNLGRTGAVEIETRPHDEALMNVRELAVGMDEYRQLSKQYHRYWSRGILCHAPASYSPDVVLERALSSVDTWRAAADPVIDELQGMKDELANLGYYQRFLNGIKSSGIYFGLTTYDGLAVSVVSAILPLNTELDSIVPQLSTTITHDDEIYFMAVVEKDDAEILHREIKSINGRLIDHPSWIAGNTIEALAQVNERIVLLNRLITGHHVQLDSLYEEYKLAYVLGDAACLEWFIEQIGTLEPVGSNLVWVTGWTTEEQMDRFDEIISEAGVPALVHFPQPPPGIEPPQLLRNPWWSRPFELFTRVFGTPAGNEVDPSPLLSVIVPLLFGYMFADVGQGLVLIVVAYWLRSRWDGAKLILVAGISATLFGFLFGSFFSYESLIPALLFHPMQNPLLTLLVPLLFGALLLVLSQILAGLESFWRGELRHWLLKDCALLVLYLGALATPLQAELSIIALIGAIWFVIGNILCDGRWYMFFGALGELLEGGVRLLVNTVSFARVGAFALAHTGLSSALVALADNTSSILGYILIILMGNAVIIILEGLVVSIQTTRLVLFEFFVRFFHGTGRPFRPLVPPPNVANAPPSNVP